MGRLHQFILAALFGLFGCLSTLRADDLQTRIDWRPFATDLEVAEAQISSGPFLTTDVIFFRTSLKQLKLHVFQASDFGMTRSTAESICRLNKAALCINANFFDEQGKALGLVVSRGILQQDIHRGGKTLTGIFQLRAGVPSIVSRETFTPEGVMEAVQAGPRLLLHGAPMPGIHESIKTSKRAGVCVDADRRVVFFTASNQWVGLTIHELQELITSKDIGCIDALNLDGGGSAQLFVNASIPGAQKNEKDISLPGRDEVPVILALSPPN